MFIKTLENMNSALNLKTNLIRYELKQGKNELNIFKLN